MLRRLSFLDWVRIGLLSASFLAWLTGLGMATFGLLLLVAVVVWLFQVAENGSRFWRFGWTVFSSELVGDVRRTIPVRWSYVVQNAALTKLLFVGSALALAGSVVVAAVNVYGFVTQQSDLEPVWFFGLAMGLMGVVNSAAPGWLVLGTRGFAWRGDSYAYDDIRSFALWPDGSRRLRVYRKQADQPSGEVISIAQKSITPDDAAAIDAAFSHLPAAKYEAETNA